MQQREYHRRRPILILTAAVVPFLIAGCDGAAEPQGDGLIVLTVRPDSATLVVGDTLAARSEVVALVTGATPSVRWRSARPAVMRVDTVAGAGAVAVLRAVGSGVDTVRVTLRVGSETVDASLPVVVRPRP